VRGHELENSITCDISARKFLCNARGDFRNRPAQGTPFVTADGTTRDARCFLWLIWSTAVLPVHTCEIGEGFGSAYPVP